MFLTIVIGFHWYGCSQESETVQTKKEYHFVQKLESAEIIAETANHVAILAGTINNDIRLILFEHPNSEVVFNDIIITPKN